MPAARGAEMAMRSTPKRPKRSITAPITSWPAIRIPIVAVAPMRGWANVIVPTTVSPITPPSHIHAGVRNAPPSPPTPARAITQDRQSEHELDAGREGERLEDADTAAEAPHHRNLHRAREPGQYRQRDRGRRHAAFGSACQRLKLLPSVSLHDGEPAVRRHRLLVVCGSAELAHLCDRRVDVVGVEVDDQARSPRSPTA